MLRFWAIVCVLLLVRQAGAQVMSPDEFLSLTRRGAGNRPKTSVSKQFVVFDTPSEGWRPAELNRVTQTNYVQLDSALLVMACDRIKAALLRDLDGADQWRGRVTIYLHQTRNPDEPLVTPPPQDPFNYYLYLPDKMERSRLVAAIVGVVLQEIANRNATDRPAEIPVWLTQGLTRQLMRERPYDLVPQLPPVGDQGIRFGGLIFEGTNAPPLQRAHEVLLARPPLTLDELSWPAAGQEEDEVYRSSAQLLVVDLLQMDGGRQGLRTMIAELAQHYNWQTSFMDAFRAQFATRLELEKWWALCVVRFTGRDLAQTLPGEESWRRLDALVHTSVQVRTAQDELPSHSEVKLQSIIGEWNLALQEAVLTGKVQYLAVLRNSISQDLAGVTDDYRQVLTGYLKQREKAGLFRKAKSQLVSGFDRVALETIQQLNTLDARREEMRVRAAPAQEAKSSGVNR